MANICKQERYQDLTAAKGVTLSWDVGSDAPYDGLAALCQLTRPRDTFIDL